jgi:hypothetical protein
VILSGEKGKNKGSPGGNGQALTISINKPSKVFAKNKIAYLYIGYNPKAVYGGAVDLRVGGNGLINRVLGMDD